MLTYLPIGNKVLEVEIPGDDVPPQGAHEDGPLGWGCLAQGVLGLGVDEVLPEVGAGEDHKVILERIRKIKIDLHLRSNSLRVDACESLSEILTGDNQDVTLAPELRSGKFKKRFCLVFNFGLGLMSVKMTQRRSFARDTTRCET